MSIRFSSLNSPPLVAATGTAIMMGLPFVDTVVAASTASLAVLKGANASAFVANAVAVSVPGRIDGKQDQDMRSGVLNPDKPEGVDQKTTGDATRVGTSTTPLVGRDDRQPVPLYTVARTRTLVKPSGWAFAIWGPIYLGEAAFVGAQVFAAEGAALASMLPQVTAPFVAANIFQSLWCASFRPSYREGWRRFISVGMLAGTAYSLSLIQAIGCSAQATSIGWYFLPMSLHFGWTTAATLVNLNSSVAMNETQSDSSIVALGHASAVAAAAMGVGVTLARNDPAYGLTLAWALAACADGMKKRLEADETGSSSLQKGAQIQKLLCWSGSAACIATSLFVVSL